MRRLAVINQKGGVGKTTTCANLGAALALSGRRVVLVDMDAQANLTLSLNSEIPSEAASTYTVLLGESKFGESLRDTSTPGLRLLPANIDLSGAELELAAVSLDQLGEPEVEGVADGAIEVRDRRAEPRARAAPPGELGTPSSGRMRHGADHTDRSAGSGRRNPLAGAVRIAILSLATTG